jgi:hypothetical protein
VGKRCRRVGGPQHRSCGEPVTAHGIELLPGGLQDVGASSDAVPDALPHELGDGLLVVPLGESVAGQEDAGVAVPVHVHGHGLPG